MNSALILFGIKSVIRIGRVGRAALEQWARDQNAIFPELRGPELNAEVFVNGFFNLPRYNDLVVGANAPYAEYWQGATVRRESSASDALFTVAVQIRAEEHGGDLDEALGQGGALLIKQWDAGKGPLSPWARIVLTAGDIALEYIAVDPSIIGLGTNGEKLIAAYAKGLSDLLPDDGRFGPKEDFGQRLLGAFLRAGFQTISQNSQLVVSEAHLQKLIATSVAPLVDALPDNLTVVDQLRWQNVADAVMGPAAAGALQTIAENQSAFLGDDFRADEALGALTQALLRQAADAPLTDQFTKEGLIGLYQAALGVAAERPQLFFDGDAPDAALARDLLAGFATVLRAAPPPFDGDVGIGLAKAALEAVGNNAHRFTDASNPWEQTAAEMLKSLTGALAASFDANGKVGDAFSKAQLIELGRIVLGRVAQSPAMIVGDGRDAWEGVIRAVAVAMTADEHLLLSGDDWIEIVRAVADEAAMNPARLFALDPADPDDVLAGKLISTLLASGSAILGAPDVGHRTVLFGKTLREATIILVSASAGNPEGAREHLDDISELLNGLNTVVAENHQRYGSKEWLRLFAILLSSTLDGTPLPALTEDHIHDLLERGTR